MGNRCLAALMLWMLATEAVRAGGVDQLKAFIDGAKTARAAFTQTVRDKTGKVTSQAGGTMQFSRPGRFRWEYAKPYQQLIVGDGQRLWIWDSDLNQVTAKKLSEALGSSPAALLAGSNEIEKSFTLIDAGSANGIDWLRALPKDKESTFESIRMGFADGSLTRMELADNFGQTTVIDFSKLERNPKLAPELFKFVPPPGADVIGEER